MKKTLPLNEFAATSGNGIYTIKEVSARIPLSPKREMIVSRIFLNDAPINCLPFINAEEAEKYLVEHNLTSKPKKKAKAKEIFT